MRADSLPPVPLTRFFGRDGTVAEVSRALTERRLVTLTGIGGVGKTRLAVAVATHDEWADITCWVGLGSVTNAETVASVLASALGIPLDPDKEPVTALLRQLRRERVLIVLDTCEHLLTAAANVAERLVSGCADVVVLATSREPLHVAGEAVWEVSPLTPADAVELFADRASLAAPGFDSSAQHEHIVAACQRLDGLPLAIELAAAWARLMSPAQILAGLDGSFRLLSGGPPGAPPRQRTLSASMAWSHDLLTEADRTTLRRLAVMRGTFTAEAAVAVAGTGETAIENLRRLVDRSLVVARPNPRTGTYRYILLDTVRQFAEDRLADVGESVTIKDRHLQHFLRYAVEAEAGLDRDEDRWRHDLALDRDNINAALEWGLAAPENTERVANAQRLAAAVSRQWLLQGQAHEGLAFLGRALARDAGDQADRPARLARLYAACAMLGMVSGRADLTATAAERGAALAIEVDDQRTLARCRAMAAYHEFFLDFDRCQQLAVEAHTRGEAAGDPFARDWALVVQAYSLTRRDRHNEAVALARAAAAQCRPRGDRFCGAFAAGVEVFATMYTGDVRHAVHLAEEMMATVEPLGDYFAVGTNTATAAVALGMAGHIDTGLELMDPVVRSIESAEDVDVVGFMVTLGQLNLWRGDLTAALRWFERGPTLIDAPFGHWTAIRCMPGLIATLRLLNRTKEAADLAERALAAAAGFGGQYVHADILDQQGHLVAADNPSAAAGAYHQALALRRQAGLRTFYTDSLDALAALAARAGQHADALRLLAASDTAREVIGYPRPPVAQPDYEQTLGAIRQAMGDDYQATWEQSRTGSLEETVAWVSRGRGPRTRPPIGWDSLTPAELEVAHLIAEGRSNPQIAAQLFVTAATVKTHLVHIYAKLGINNRAALASIAARRDRQA